MEAGGGGDVLAASTAPLTWHDFLERMRHPSAADLVKSIKSFIVTFTNNDPDPEKDSEAVQQFLCDMDEAFRGHSLWAGSSTEELESAGEGLEKYIMTKLFSRVFASVPEDVKSDEELFEKLSLLQQFVRPENLDVKPEYQNETAWLLAQKELQKINMYKAPRDKLVCILNCCKVINNLLINASITSNENPPGADEFLPVLIYVTIKANPPQLHSNLQYIQRYRRQSRLVSEAAYFFTHILSAESFIWNIDAQALSMDDADFQNKMDAAKELLSELSTTASHADHEESERRPESGSVNLHGSEQDVQNQLHDLGSADGKDKPAISSQSVSNLAKKGVAELLKEENLHMYFHEYPFLFARAGDLTVADVEELLGNYKKLVLKYVSLCKGKGITLSQANGAVRTSDLRAVTESQNDEGNAGGDMVLNEAEMRLAIDTVGEVEPEKSAADLKNGLQT